MTRIAPAILYFAVALAAFPLTFVMTARPALAQDSAYHSAQAVQPAATSRSAEKGLF